MTPSEKAEALIRHYFDMCNAADRQGLIDCFTPEGTHYFPPGLPGAPWRGAESIADGWVNCVQKMGSKWTIEKVLCGADGREAVIESAGTLFETGIYAHAPAVHRYELAGRWKRLTGSCGLPTQRGGSVVFVIRADGREVFRSPALQPGRSATYDVPLDGVTTLELATEDAGDGNGSDWGMWLGPELSR